MIGETSTPRMPTTWHKTSLKIPKG